MLRVPPGLALRVSPAIWQRLFAAYGAPPGLTKKARADAVAIARALWAGPLPARLLEAIVTLALFATPEGRAAFEEASLDIPRDLSIRNGETDADLAGRLLAERASDETL